MADETSRAGVPRAPARTHGFLPREAVLALGFSSVGENVLIDESARFYGAERIRIGSDGRIDAFAVLSAGSGGIVIGNHNHLAVSVLIVGDALVQLGDFVGLSAHARNFSSNDDYHGSALTGPTVPDRFRKVTSVPVVVDDHVIVGAGSVVLPGVRIAQGAAVGALSIVKRDVAPFTIVAGPAGRVIGTRDRDLLLLAAELRSSTSERADRPPPVEPV